MERQVSRAIVCWGCGGEAPNTKQMPRYGWRTRPVVIDGFKMVQVSCVVCFNQYGFGERETQESQ